MSTRKDTKCEAPKDSSGSSDRQAHSTGVPDHLEVMVVASFTLPAYTPLFSRFRLSQPAEKPETDADENLARPKGDAVKDEKGDISQIMEPDANDISRGMESIDAAIRDIVGEKETRECNGEDGGSESTISNGAQTQQEEYEIDMSSVVEISQNGDHGDTGVEIWASSS